MEQQAIDLDRFASKGEAVIARRLVRIALEQGYAISISDGEEWTVKSSTNRMEIISALASTDMDTLRIRKDGQRVGDFELIWGNSPTGEELIADHTDNDQCNELYKLVVR